MALKLDVLEIIRLRTSPKIMITRVWVVLLRN